MANPPFLYFLGDPLIEMLERAHGAGVPVQEQWSAGVPLSFGSDAPGYYPVDPLRDLGTAAAHQTLSGAKLNAAENLSDAGGAAHADRGTRPTRGSSRTAWAAWKWASWPT